MQKSILRIWPKLGWKGFKLYFFTTRSLTRVSSLRQSDGQEDIPQSVKSLQYNNSLKYDNCMGDGTLLLQQHVSTSLFEIIAGFLAFLWNLPIEEKQLQKTNLQQQISVKLRYSRRSMSFNCVLLVLCLSPAFFLWQLGGKYISFLFLSSFLCPSRGSLQVTNWCFC